MSSGGWGPTVRVVTPATPVRHHTSYFGASSGDDDDISNSLSVLMLSPDMNRNVSGGSNLSSDTDATLVAADQLSIAPTPGEMDRLPFPGRLVLSPQVNDDAIEALGDVDGLGIQHRVSFADAVDLGLCTDGTRRRSIGFALPDPREELGVGHTPQKTGHARRPTPYPGREVRSSLIRSLTHTGMARRGRRRRARQRRVAASRFRIVYRSQCISDTTTQLDRSGHGLACAIRFLAHFWPRWCVSFARE